MKTVIVALFLFLIPVSSLPALQIVAPKFAEFNSISEVVERWNPDQHLWVQGRIGVSQKQLEDLEIWLDKNGPNWTVVLMQNARNQAWRNFQRMNAVENALGKGLSNQTGFGKLTDPRTGEANGAVFVLFLEERKFSYFASDVFDKRNLGESQWIGRLDGPAISAMRSGGRIVDAAKNTVMSIQRQLGQKLKAEETIRKRIAIEKKRLIEESKFLAARLMASIKKAEASRGKLQAENELLSGDLINPDLGGWTANAKAVDDYAAIGDYKNAHKLTNETKVEIAAFHQGLKNWVVLKPQLDLLAERIESHPNPPEVSEIQGYLSIASDSLASARINHAEGKSLYATQLNAGVAAMDRAERAYQKWLMLEEMKRRAEKKQQMVIRVLIGLAIVLLLIGMIVANRLRVPKKEEAEKELRKWKDQLRGKFDLLFNLMDRTAMMVGPNARLENRNFDGETRNIAKATIRGVDELFIMSTATDRVIDLVENLIEPRTPWGIFMNALSERRFAKALDLLGAKPIGFDQEEGLEAILSPTKNRPNQTAARVLLGETGDYKPFRMSFENLIAAYDEKQDTTRENLERLEHCIDGLPLLQDRVGGNFDLLNRKVADLFDASLGDGWFPLVAIRNKLVPTIETNLSEAARVGQTDPVTAMENTAGIAERQVNEALRMVNKIEAVRANDFPIINTSVDSLEKLKRRSGWIDQEMDILTGRSEQIANLAVSRSVSEDWEAFEDDVMCLKGQIVSSVKLVERSVDELLPAIEARRKTVAVAKETISQRLDLPGEDVLVEKNLSPGKKIELVRNQLDAALSALDHGNITAAQEDYSEIESQLSEVDELIRVSLEALEEHSKNHAKLVSECEDIGGEIPKASKTLISMQQTYSPEVVLFSARYGGKVSGQQSISNNIERAESRLAGAVEALEESEETYKNGGLIASIGFLERAANELGFSEHQIALVVDQHQALEKAEKLNPEKLSALQSRHGDLQTAVGDFRTCQPTIEDHSDAGESLAGEEIALRQEKPNPFSVFHVLARQELVLNGVESSLDSDWDLFDKAEVSERKAGELITSCGEFVQQAKTDRIADSEATTRAIRQHGELTEELKSIAKQLKSAHGDWAQVFDEMSSITAKTADVRARLMDELKAAREAVEQIDGASSQIRTLAAWTSSYSVTIDRNAGTQTWRDASDFLAQGDYPNARKLAIAAKGEAKLALSTAKSREQQRRSAAAAAAAARRAAARAASRRSSSSSWSSSSSSSGFSSSSFSSSSSSSGFSRSGW